MPRTGPAIEPVIRTQAPAVSPADHAPHATGPDQYLFITPVWGEAYVERFLKLSLPSQISAGNLGAIPAARAHYLIYTRREHIAEIRHAPAFRRLRDLIPVSIFSIDDLPDPDLNGNPHPVQTAAYTRGIAFADGGNTAFVFLTPDVLIGDGSIENMVRLADAGKRVVLVAGVRMSTDGAVACLARHRQGPQPEVTIPPRALVRICLEYLHPISTGHVVTNAEVHGAQHLYWKVGDHGLLVRGFHLHPLMVWPRDTDVNIRNTLDDEYISRACPDRADWHTVTDTDEISVFEFSEQTHKLGMISTRPMTDHDILKFIHRDTNPDHRVLVNESIRLHAGPIDPAEWEPVVQQANGFVRKYLDLYAQQGPPPDDRPPTAPPPVRSRGLRALFNRSSGSTGPNELSIVAMLMLGLMAPLWFLYRIFHHKLYRYLDRLNAELIETRNRLTITEQRLEVAQTQLDQLAESHKRMRSRVRRPR